MAQQRNGEFLYMNVDDLLYSTLFICFLCFSAILFSSCYYFCSYRFVFFGLLYHFGYHYVAKRCMHCIYTWHFEAKFLFIYSGRDDWLPPLMPFALRLILFTVAMPVVFVRLWDLSSHYISITHVYRHYHTCALVF